MSEVAPEVTAPVEAAAVEAVPVEQAVPSNVAEVVAEVSAAEEVVKTLEEAAKELLALVDEGHKIGSREIDAARDELRKFFAKL